MMTFLLTRPYQQSKDLADFIGTYGHKCLISPMLEIANKPINQKSLEGAQAIIATSQNALFALKDSSFKIPDLPLFVCGPVSKMLAYKLGFSEVYATGGGKNELADLIKAQQVKGTYIYISGDFISEGTEAILKSTGIEYRRLEVYSSEQSSVLSDDVQKALRDGKITHTVFASQRSAENFMRLILKYHLQEALKKTKALCISQPVINCISNYEWKEVHLLQSIDLKESLKNIMEAEL